MEGDSSYIQGNSGVNSSSYEAPRRSYSRSPIRAAGRSRSPAPRRRYSRSPVPRRRDSRSPAPRRRDSRSPAPRRRDSRSRDRYGRDSRDRYPRDYRDSRDSRDYRNDRFDRRDRFERRPAPPRERRPVYRGTEEERAASKTLFIGNLPFNFEDRDVSHLMERFGPLRKITIPMERFSRRNRGFCFVEFEERRDAEDAMQKYQGHPVEGRELRIDWDVGTERKPVDREFSYRPSREVDDRKMDRSPIRSRSISRSPVRPEDY